MRSLELEFGKESKIDDGTRTLSYASVPLNRQEKDKKRKLDIIINGSSSTSTSPHYFSSIDKTPEHESKRQQLLSPELSSPLWPPKSKKAKTLIDTAVRSNTSRSNGSNALGELIDHLSDVNKILTLHDPSKKPPYSYAMLIGVAILQSEDRRLSLSQIYRWISSKFPYYRLCDTRWQNSIRHNLSLNEAFVKGGKSLDGKGHFWEVKPDFKNKFFKNGSNQIGSVVRKKLNSVNKASGDTDISSVQEAESDVLINQKNGYKNYDFKEKRSESSYVFRKKFRSADTSKKYDSDSDLNEETLSECVATRLPSAVESCNAKKTGFGARNIDKGIKLEKCYLVDTDSKLQTNQYSIATNEINTADNLGSKIGNAYINLLKGELSLDESQTENNMTFPLLHRYTCSFNSCIEPASPEDTNSSNGPIMEMPLTEPKILHTPKSKELHNFPIIRTPIVSTPHCSSASGKPQTPFFDDFFGSPLIIKPSGTPIVCVDDCMLEEDRIIGIKSPKKQTTAFPSSSAGSRSVMQKHKIFDSSTISSNVLFGVDVCSIWKRAVENFELENKPSTEFQN